MSTVRITQRLMVERSLSAMQSSSGRLARAQDQLSSGRLITRPSDSPTGTSTAMQLRDQVAAEAQYSRNASDGLGWLGTADNTLSTMLDSTRRARDLIVQSTSATSATPQGREAIAAELDQIRNELLSLANTKQLGRPIFGGTTDKGTAYNSAGEFAGVAGEVNRTVGDGVQVRVDTLGPTAFGDNGSNLFDVLQATVGALRDPNGDATGQLDALDTVTKKMSTALTDVGTRYARVESALSSVNSRTLDTQAALSEVEDVDVAKAAVDLQMQQLAYQAALGATARVIQPSLIDFLR